MRPTGGAARTASVSRARAGESSRQRCQCRGTSRWVRPPSVTSAPARGRRASCGSGSIPQPEAEADGLVEVGAGRHPVHDGGLGRRRARRARRAGGASFSLKTTTGIRAQSWPRPRRQRSASAGVAAGPVAQRRRGARPAALHRPSGRGSPRPAPRRGAAGRPSRPGPRRPAAARRPSQRGDLAEHLAEPGGQRVGVDRDRQVDDRPAPCVERRRGLVVQQPGLPRQPDQRLARRGRSARRRPRHDDLADLRLERADPLADRARRHVQARGPRPRRCRGRRWPPGRRAGRGRGP